MDLDCTLEFGVCHEIISKSRKDWSLAHDVKLLKYLEKFSQSLISRTGEALKSLEEFENDLSSLSLNIQTVSQRFQSLANKQFIEHCVLEDDISTYTKQNRNTNEVPSSTSNVLLNDALSTCLSSFHVKYNNYKDSYSITKSSNAASGVLSSQYLLPLIGSPHFNDYYIQLLSVKECLKEPMQKSEVNVGDNISDKQSFQESLSLHSSSNVALDEDTNSLLGNHVSYNEVDPTNSSVSGDVDGSMHGIYSGVVNSIKLNEPKQLEDWVSQDNETVKSNGYDINPPKNQSLFDDDDSEGDPDDLFLFSKSKPFAERTFVEDEGETFPSSNKNPMSPPVDSFNSKKVTSKNEEFSQPRGLIISKNQSLFGTDTYENKAVTSKQNSSSTKDHSTHHTASSENKLNSPNTSNTLKSDILKESQNIVTNKNKDSTASEGMNDSKGLSFNSSLMASNLKEKNFSLFSDQEDSDDELFSSSKQKNSKENFKKLLEEKISSFGGNANLSGKLNKNKCADIINSNSGYQDKDISVTSAKENHGDNGSLPSYDTSMLHSLVKNRARIKNKRRPPSRKHLKDIQSVYPSGSGSTKKEEKRVMDDITEESGSTVSVLSPSTEEEDLFVVPTTSMVHEVSCSNLFSASSLLSPGSSLDNQKVSIDCSSDKNIIESTRNESEDSFSTAKSDNSNSFVKDPSFFSGVPPSISDLKFESNEDDTNKKTDSSLKFSWSNRESLFNDSDEDDDDLFSSTFRIKINEKKVPVPISNRNSESVTRTQVQSKLDNDFFKDVFSNNSDDDDLFKTKDSSSNQTKSGQLVKPVQDSTNSPNELNGNKIVRSNNEFKDPLSCFQDNQTD